MKLRLHFAPLILCALALFACAGTQVERTVTEDGRSKYAGSTASELQKKNRICGRVKTIDRHKTVPVASAVVEIKNENLGVGYYKVTTDRSGYFEIDDVLPHIRYVIDVSAPGYISRRSTEELGDSDISIMLDKASIIQGTVLGSDGGALPGIDVRIAPLYTYQDNSRSMRQSVTTDAKGAYRIESVAEGSYAVTFKKEGYITETARLERISSGETMKLPMRMYRKSSVAGQISIQDIGTAAINIQVSLSGRASHYTTTFSDGTFRIEDVNPGEYTVALAHQGFHTPKPFKISVREGENRENMNFSLKAREPQIEVSAYRYTFTPGMKLEFATKSLRLDKIKTRIFRVPASVLLRGRSDPNTLDPAKEKFTVAKEWEDLVKNFTPYEWRYQSVEFGDALPEGGYCIEVSGADRVFSRKFFTVTTVGIVVKRSRESVFAYASNLVTNKPVAGAQIAVFDNTPVEKKPQPQADESQENTSENGDYEPMRESAPQSYLGRIEDLPIKIITKGTTDAGGIFRQPLSSPVQLSLLAVAPDGSFAFCNTGSPLVFSNEESKYFIYTDRPVYRAGDKVSYKIIGKKRESGFTPMSQRHVFFQISNRDTGTVVSRGEYTFDEWGTANDRIVLSPEWGLGEFEIRVGADKDNLHGAGHFFVEQYRKPEFTISVTPMKSFYSNDDTAEF